MGTGGRVPTTQAPGSYGSQSAWPQWQPTAGDAMQQSSQHAAAAAAAATHSQASSNPQGAGQSGQQEEFSDVLRMLDNSGSEFNDLSGVFNHFTE